MNQNQSQGTVQSSAESANEKSWFDLGIHPFIKIAILSILIWWIFREEINSIVHQWLSNPSWSHGFLIPLFSLYFLNQSKNEIIEQKDTFRPSWLVGLPMLLFFLALYPVNIAMLKFMYGKPLIMIATIGASVLFIGGWKLLKYTWLPVAYLFFAVPLPARLHFQLTNPMRAWAAQIATIILNWVPNVQATISGVTIKLDGIALITHESLEGTTLDVAEACSGMRLLMTFVALGVAMAYLHWRPIWQRLILLCSTIPIAIFCNFIRVTITGFIYVLGFPKYAKEPYHSLLGLLMLSLAFALYGGLAWLMNNLFVDEENTQQEDVIIRKSSSRQSRES
ncbi:MAG: exosortase/archaeosortase family protein [Phycisphaerae bacterium]|nr:exosortase/archaeosortase family protein [Phycisphaerae bacterium]